MKALLIPEARMMFVSLGADGAPSYRLETLDDWIARVKARGHAMLEEKQLKFHIERYGNIAHLWSSYVVPRQNHRRNNVTAAKLVGRSFGELHVKINGFNLAEESQLALIVPHKQSSRLANGSFAREATLRNDDCND